MLEYWTAITQSLGVEMIAFISEAVTVRHRGRSHCMHTS